MPPTEDDFPRLTSERFSFSAMFVRLPLDVSALWLWALMPVHCPHEIPLNTSPFWGVFPPSTSKQPPLGLNVCGPSRPHPTVPPTILGRPCLLPLDSGALNPGSRRKMESRE